MHITWERYKCNLPCFKSVKNFYFPIPQCVQRSTTADFVRTGFTSDDSQRKKFLELRSLGSQLCSLWEKARERFEFTINLQNPTPSEINQQWELLNQTASNYKKCLCLMAKNGIWNCAEFAHFALIIIDEAYLLCESRYIAHTEPLNNPQIPAGAKNHDHVFVLITNRQGGEEFVIDLWQGLVGGKPFFGTFNEYLNFLNTNPDGRYILYSGVARPHFRVVSERRTRMAVGESDEQSGLHLTLGHAARVHPFSEYQSESNGADLNEAFSGLSLDGSRRPIKAMFRNRNMPA